MRKFEGSFLSTVQALIIALDSFSAKKSKTIFLDTVAVTDSEDEEDATETLRARMDMISRFRTESESRRDIDEQELQATNYRNFQKLK